MLPCVQEFRSLLESFETSHNIKLRVKMVFCVALIAKRVCSEITVSSKPI